MLQIVQPTGGGEAQVVRTPAPSMSSTSILVDTRASLISAGTERAVTQLAQASLLAKAKARPDLVRQVVSKARVDGVQSALNAVRSKLADDLPLGYSGAGTVVAVGPDASGFRVGQRVATGGGGFACHAEMQVVPWVLACGIPDEVSYEQASFATVASVGLHGLRQAEIRLGSKVLVIGLGLIGQLTARIAVAAGCDVLGTDVSQELIRLAQAHGITGLVEAGSDSTRAVLDWSRGRGADAVIITAGAAGDSTIIKSIPERCRDRATVVAVGDVGLDLVRNDFYMKEIDLRLARSYGPGRYDRSYEEWGVDYPIGHVRWTEGRNQEAVIDLLATGRLQVDDLITHRFPIADASNAYEVLDSPKARPLGIVLTYEPSQPSDSETTNSVHERFRKVRSIGETPSIGLLGSGSFARSVILPSLPKAGFGPVVNIASTSGITAARLAESAGIGRVSATAEEVITDPEVDVVAIATRHSSHAELVVRALEAGKHVYCEKPLALSWEELAEVEATLQARPEQSLYVGLNRRYSPMISKARQVLHQSAGPVHIQYRISAGSLLESHWYSDRRERGRLLGEVCHFIDTCSALVGDRPTTRITALSPRDPNHDTYHILVEYDDRSTASVLYCADTYPKISKERIEVNGRKHTIVIDNFRQMFTDGRKGKVPAGKGHIEGLAAWRSGAGPGTALETTRIMLRISDYLSSRLDEL